MLVEDMKYLVNKQCFGQRANCHRAIVLITESDAESSEENASDWELV